MNNDDSCRYEYASHIFQRVTDDIWDMHCHFSTFTFARTRWIQIHCFLEPASPSTSPGNLGLVGNWCEGIDIFKPPPVGTEDKTERHCKPIIYWTHMRHGRTIPYLLVAYLTYSTVLNKSHIILILTGNLHKMAIARALDWYRMTYIYKSKHGQSYNPPNLWRMRIRESTLMQ